MQEEQSENQSVEKNNINIEIKKEPKKPILKDKTGEILITKLDTYIEPVKAIKEARGGDSK